MNIDETTLRAYVDGELPRDQRDQVEAALNVNDELCSQVKALRASCLPYRAAFEMQLLPPLPAALARQIGAWSAVAGAVPGGSAAAAAGGVTRRRWAQWSGAGAALAASFAAGLLIPTPWRRAPEAAAPQVAGWIEAVAKYQAMYVRETVDQAVEDPARTRAMLTAFSRQSPTPVTVPDLRDAGLTYKRMQRLGLGDRPLLQMVFMPAEGKPAALCVLPAKGADAPVDVRRLEGLAIASWKRGGLGYVFAADMPNAQAAVIAEKLTTQQFPPLVTPLA